MHKPFNNLGLCILAVKVKIHNYHLRFMIAQNKIYNNILKSTLHLVLIFESFRSLTVH